MPRGPRKSNATQHNGSATSSVPKNNASSKSAKPNILFIEGFCIIADCMSTKIRGIPSTFHSKAELHHSRRCWNFATITPVQCFLTGDGPVRADMDAIDRCRAHLTGGKFHAVVVVDLSENQDMFAKELGPSLAAFARAGGTVAFPTSEAHHTSPTMNAIFGTAWIKGGYYRTDWGVASENAGYVRHVFGTDVWTFSAKGCSLRNVPPHERCWGVTSKSRTQSRVFATEDVSKPDVGDSEWPDSDYDVLVAMHQHGAGWMLCSGDSNLENETVTLVSNFIKSRAPSSPVPVLAPHTDLSTLTSDEFAAVKNVKNVGNAHFSAKRYTEALVKYDAALAIYGSRTGDAQQMEEKVKILSNKSECFLMKKEWWDAEKMASAALALDPMHEKSLMRKAKAHVKMAEDSEDIDSREDELEIAKKIIEKLHEFSEPSLSSEELFRRVCQLADQLKEGNAGTSQFGSHDDGPMHTFRSTRNGASINFKPPVVVSRDQPAKTAWMDGLSAQKRYEWLIDCYRLRVNDEYTLGGDEEQEMYFLSGTMTKDFLIFCRLARQHGVIPHEWDWAAFVRTARDALPQTFKEADAQEKHAGENASSAATGVRLLRDTASVVYACTVESLPPALLKKAIDEVMWSRRLGKVCGNVGGTSVWEGLLSDLEEEWAMPF